jgi:hypothetical protein
VAAVRTGHPCIEENDIIEDTIIMKKIFAGMIAVLVFNGGVWADGEPEGMRLFDVAIGRKTTLKEVLSDIRQKRRY